jgi:hypothetical protein
MGNSTGNSVTCPTAGTLGAAVRDNSNPSCTGYVTCSHVAAGTGGCVSGNGIDQVAPARGDVGCNATLPPIVGHLVRIRDVDSGGAVFHADAAFVEAVDGAIDVQNECGLCAPVAATTTPEKALGQKVFKCGRTTSLTCGIVVGIGCDVTIQYGTCDDIDYVDQILVQGDPFSVDGDSGAMAYTADGAAVGLVIGGDGDAITWVTPVETVLTLLDVSLLPMTGCSGNVKYPPSQQRSVPSGVKPP